MALESKISTAVSNGRLDVDSVVVCCIDRGEGRVYKQQWCVGEVPTLTTSNRYMIALSVADLHTPDCDRRLSRFVSPKERLALQGFPPIVHTWLGSDNLAIKAAGNAYPVPLTLASLHPLVCAIEGRITLLKWPPPGLLNASTAAKSATGVCRKLRPRPKPILKRKRHRSDSESS